jgi:flagellum-specific ATP synthase
MSGEIDFSKYKKAVHRAKESVEVGFVSRIVGLVIEGEGPDVPVGSMVRIFPRGEEKPVEAEVVGFSDSKILMMPLATPLGLGPNCRIEAIGSRAAVSVDGSILGRVLDGLGRPIDGKGPLDCADEMPLYAEPINPVIRKRITEPLDLGVRSINGSLTAGRGQRIGIIAGTGVGKSVLLGMMAKNTNADVTVIGFVGERGREVREFLDKNLGEEGMKRSVIVTATSDNTPLVRLRSAFTATAIAEYFREQGKDVLLLIDSLTRFSMAQREIGLSIGEPPATKGYTPSVFAQLPKILERAGTKEDNKGSITGIYTILVEGDDINEPISDASRAILDGHIVLSRELAARGHFPAVDIMASISRVMIDVVNPEHMDAAAKLRRTLAIYRDAEELINIGAYVRGSNPEIDAAIEKMPAIENYLRQPIGESSTLEESINGLKGIA